jgi:hypothetical protein
MPDRNVEATLDGGRSSRLGRKRQRDRMEKMGTFGSREGRLRLVQRGFVVSGESESDSPAVVGLQASDGTQL